MNARMNDLLLNENCNQAESNRSRVRCSDKRMSNVTSLSKMIVRGKIRRGNYCCYILSK